LRRASTFTVAALAVTGLLALADTASAQSAPGAGETRGLRYLSWPGRGEPADPAARDTAPPAPVRAELRRPNTVIPHGGFTTTPAPEPRRLTPAPGSARRTLTPANAWLQPRSPVPVSAAPPPTAATPSPPPPPPPAPPGPEYLPDQGGSGQPAPAAIVYPASARPDETAPAAAVSDPMAPRRDAPIFRMQQAAPPPPAAAEHVPEIGAADIATAREPYGRDGGRYYSVHRQNGREPDALVMPAPTYVDALVVSSIDTLASQDLAEPEQGPTLIRDRNGNMRAAPAASDGDHQ